MQTAYTHIPKKLGLIFVWILAVLVFSFSSSAQVRPPGNFRLDNQGRPIGPAAAGGDSLQQRDSNEDSITIFFRMFDSSRIRFIDSNINDFTIRFPLPAEYIYLNQLGSAARSVIFAPNTRPGYDPGIHGYD
ncbi:MAG TPA: hypothetical protein VK907_05400, partial [Phnomibacter sp.]|nr:hypothetical protein [Phnomibacter sp.]